jgi:hypothetical protein
MTESGDSRNRREVLTVFQTVTGTRLRSLQSALENANPAQPIPSKAAHRRWAPLGIAALCQQIED